MYTFLQLATTFVIHWLTFAVDQVATCQIKIALTLTKYDRLKSAVNGLGLGLSLELSVCVWRGQGGILEKSKCVT